MNLHTTAGFQPRVSQVFTVPTLLAAIGCGAEHVAVTEPNRAPINTAAIPPQTVTVGQAATVDVANHFTDPDGDGLTFTAVTSDADVVLASMSGSVATISAVARGRATITVTARDSGGLSTAIAFPVTVPNQPPIAAGVVPDQSVIVGASVALDMAAYFTDPDGDALKYAVATSDVSVASAAISSGTATSASVVTITGVARGSATVTVTASDTEGASANLVISVVVPNQPPRVVAAVTETTMPVGESKPVDVAFYFNDPDGDDLTYYGAASSNVSVAGVSIDGSVVIVSAVSQGTSTVKVSARDPEGLSATLTFGVTVPNRAPTLVVAVPDQSVFVGDSIQVELADHVTDPDGDVLTYDGVTSSDATVVRPSIRGSMVILAAVKQGDVTVRVNARDTYGLSAGLSFSVAVPNRAPIAEGNIPAQSMVEGIRVYARTSIDVAPYFSDPDGDILEYTASSSNPGIVTVGPWRGTTVTLRETPYGEGLGAAIITVVASDPGGLSVVQEVTISVVSSYPNVGGEYDGTFIVTDSAGVTSKGTMSVNVQQSGASLIVVTSAVYLGRRTNLPTYTASVSRHGNVSVGLYEFKSILDFVFDCGSVNGTMLFSDEGLRYTEKSNWSCTHSSVFAVLTR